MFAQANWDINSSWTLTGGLRHSKVAFGSEDYLITAGNPNDSGSASYSATNPVFGATYHLSDNVNLYANYGKGFETPTFTELAYRNDASGLNFGLQAARSRHYELGAKLRLGEQHAFDVALFRADTGNEIVVDTNSGGRTTFKNAGATRRQGIELAWRGRFDYGLSALVSLTAMSAKFSDGFVSGSTVVPARNWLPGTPDRLINGARTPEQVRPGNSPCRRSAHATLHRSRLSRLPDLFAGFQINIQLLKFLLIGLDHAQGGLFGRTDPTRCGSATENIVGLACHFERRFGLLDDFGRLLATFGRQCVLQQF